MLQHALKGQRVLECVLAIVIWHEIAHIDGANESEARRREENVWREFLAAGKFDTAQGLTYLGLFAKATSKSPRSPLKGKTATDLTSTSSVVMVSGLQKPVTIQALLSREKY